MTTSLLEIVDLGNGEIVLQRADDDSHNDPLVTIQFSEESRLYIADQGLEVAKAMIQAGIQAAAHISEQLSEHDSDSLADAFSDDHSEFSRSTEDDVDLSDSPSGLSERDADESEQYRSRRAKDSRTARSSSDRSERTERKGKSGPNPRRPRVLH